MTESSSGGYSYVDEEAISQDLKCPVCFYPLIDPVVHQDGLCDNTFCAPCVARVDVCPLCRGTENLRQPAPRMVKNLLSALRVICDDCRAEMSRGDFPSHMTSRCPRRCPRGCGFVGTFDTLPSHETNDCLRTPVPCPHCGETISRGYMTRHVDSCERAPLACLLCFARMTRADVRTHAGVCPAVRVACPLCFVQCTRATLKEHSEEFCPRLPEDCAGCGKTMPREEMEAHVRDVCGFTRIPCPLDCGKSFPRNQHKAHLQHCATVPLACEYCAAECSRAMLAAHEELCPRKPAACAGCDELIARDEMSAHLENVCPAARIPCPSGCGASFQRRQTTAHSQHCALAKVWCKYCGVPMARAVMTAHLATCGAAPAARVASAAPPRKPSSTAVSPKVSPASPPARAPGSAGVPTTTPRTTTTATTKPATPTASTSPVRPFATTTSTSPVVPPPAKRPAMSATPPLRPTPVTAGKPAATTPSPPRSMFTAKEAAPPFETEDAHLQWQNEVLRSASERAAAAGAAPTPPARPLTRDDLLHILNDIRRDLAARREAQARGEAPVYAAGQEDPLAGITESALEGLRETLESHDAPEGMFFCDDCRCFHTINPRAGQREAPAADVHTGKSKSAKYRARRAAQKEAAMRAPPPPRPRLVNVELPPLGPRLILPDRPPKIPLEQLRLPPRGGSPYLMVFLIVVVVVVWFYLCWPSLAKHFN